MLAVFVAAISGLVYELVAGALSSYVLGDSVTQFSLVIGLFLTAMGVGSWLSRFLERDLLAWFIGVEIAVGTLGGLTALVGFTAFAFTELYIPVLFGCVLGVGILVGLEVPIVVRLLREWQSLPVSLANVLSADYAGALVASLLFPFALLPHLGLVRAGLVMGLANVGVAALLLWKVPPPRQRSRRVLASAVVASMLLLGTSIAAAGRLTTWLEDRLYQDEIVLAEDSGAQRIVLTRWRDDLRLYLNGHLQFSTIDEYRYHESLVHPAMSVAERRARVLVLGGGDGLAVREVLRHEGVERVDLVDLDPRVTELFATRPMLIAANGGALRDPRVRVHNVDAMQFLASTTERWDVVLMDLPDPSDPQIAKLYSRSFFGLAVRHLSAGGALASQATSPFRSREAFWCIVATIEALGTGPEDQDLQVRPYHVVIPSFGTWGFVLATERAVDLASIRAPAGSRFLSPEVTPGLFAFPKDMARVDSPVSEIDRPVVADLYRAGYHQYLE